MLSSTVCFNRSKLGAKLGSYTNRQQIILNYLRYLCCIQDLLEEVRCSYCKDLQANFDSGFPLSLSGAEQKPENHPTTERPQQYIWCWVLLRQIIKMLSFFCSWASGPCSWAWVGLTTLRYVAMSCERCVFGIWGVAKVVYWVYSGCMSCTQLHEWIWYFCWKLFFAVNFIPIYCILSTLQAFPPWPLLTWYWAPFTNIENLVCVNDIYKDKVFDKFSPRYLMVRVPPATDRMRINLRKIFFVWIPISEKGRVDLSKSSLQLRGVRGGERMSIDPRKSPKPTTGSLRPPPPTQQGGSNSSDF